MSAPPYIDTSALAKWYLNEPRSEDFEAFITQQTSAAISRLTVLEFRCLLARRRRAREITRPMEKRIIAAFETDLRRGSLDVHPLDDQHALDAIELLEPLDRYGLRTLDALHLAVARDTRAGLVATADRVMAAATETLGFTVERFD